MAKLIRMAVMAAMLVVAAVPALASGTSKHAPRSHPVLHFFKKIGVGWQTDKFGWMGFVAFSPDGKMVASDGPAKSNDVSGDLTIWSFPDGRLLKRLPGRPYSISRDWKYYAVVKEIRKEIRSVDTGKPMSPPTGSDIEAGGQRNPDGTILATGHWDLIGLRNANTGERIATLRGFGRYVGAISFSKDGKFLAAGTDMGQLQIWDVRHRKKLHSLDLGGGDVSQSAFSPDGRFVAVGTYWTGTVWLVDVRTGKLVDQQKVSDLGCGAVAFSPDGRYLITPSTGGLITWPYDKGGSIRVFRVKRTTLAHRVQ